MNWLADYHEYTDCTESPKLMHLWTGIGSLVAVMRRNYYIPFGHVKIFPYVYTVLVGPPGVVQKSTTLGFATKLLSKINGVELAPDATSPQKLLMCLEGAARNVITKEGTEVHHCLTVASSEFASIINGCDAETMITWLTDLFDREDKFAYQTKTQGSNEISNPWMQLMACTTPNSLQNCLPINTVSDGLTSRIIFVYADKKDKLIAVPRAPKESLVSKLVSGLEDISTNQHLYIFSDEALEWWTHFYVDINSAWVPTDGSLEKAEKIISLTEVNMHKAFGGMGTNPQANYMITLVNQLRDTPMTYKELYSNNFLNIAADDLSSVLEGLLTTGAIKKYANDGSIVYAINKDSTSSIFVQSLDSTELGARAWDIILND